MIPELILIFHFNRTLIFSQNRVLQVIIMYVLYVVHITIISHTYDLQIEWLTNLITSKKQTRHIDRLLQKPLTIQKLQYTFNEMCSFYVCCIVSV